MHSKSSNSAFYPGVGRQNNVDQGLAACYFEEELYENLQSSGVLILIFLAKFIWMVAKFALRDWMVHIESC